METLLGREGAFIDRIYSCRHHPEKGYYGEVSELKISLFCRKPNPGMLFQACDELNINLSLSWMVEDSDIDIQAGRAASCKTVFLGESHPLATQNVAQAVDYIFERS
ncbi:HAD-hyrolase-like [Brevinema andersonii]|uniref:HAD-hyrolase-like n=1 Tax=Brevinema andersonii TaxID=34097 RepID=A0A1I1D1W6_BREAD|nr:HAD hydrolase-like protein [Brevinema andersonii]SFB68777.1 HAD-hyrolase-like [Brevinema andersonii]